MESGPIEEGKGIFEYDPEWLEKTYPQDFINLTWWTMFNGPPSSSDLKLRASLARSTLVNIYKYDAALQKLLLSFIIQGTAAYELPLATIKEGMKQLAHELTKLGQNGIEINPTNIAGTNKALGFDITSTQMQCTVNGQICLRAGFLSDGKTSKGWFAPSYNAFLRDESTYMPIDIRNQILNENAMTQDYGDKLTRQYTRVWEKDSRAAFPIFTNIPFNASETRNIVGPCLMFGTTMPTDAELAPPREKIERIERFENRRDTYVRAPWLWQKHTLSSMSFGLLRSFMLEWLVEELNDFTEGQKIIIENNFENYYRLKLAARTLNDTRVTIQALYRSVVYPLVIQYQTALSFQFWIHYMLGVPLSTLVQIQFGMPVFDELTTQGIENTTVLWHLEDFVDRDIYLRKNKPGATRLSNPLPPPEDLDRIGWRFTYPNTELGSLLKMMEKYARLLQKKIRTISECTMYDFSQAVPPVVAMTQRDMTWNGDKFVFATHEFARKQQNTQPTSEGPNYMREACMPWIALHMWKRLEEMDGQKPVGPISTPQVMHSPYHLMLHARIAADTALARDSEIIYTDEESTSERLKRIREIRKKLHAEIAVLNAVTTEGNRYFYDTIGPLNIPEMLTIAIEQASAPSDDEDLFDSEDESSDVESIDSSEEEGTIMDTSKRHLLLPHVKQIMRSFSNVNIDL